MPCNYQAQLERTRSTCHSGCVFNLHPPVEDLSFEFKPNGVLTATFVCTKRQQGYDGMAHGGIVGAIIDESMVQCCMGYDIVAVTTDLSIRYRRPVLINRPVELETSILKERCGKLVLLKCEIKQDGKTAVSALGRFFRKK